MKIVNEKFYRPCVRNPASGWLQIGHKLEKSHGVIICQHDVVNIIIGSGIMTIFVYKRLTRNPEIGNISV